MRPTTDQTETFRPHPKVVEALERQVEPWHLAINGINLFASARFHKGYEDRVVYQALTKIDHDWVRLRALVPHDSSRVDFWAWLVAGDTSSSAPRFPRRSRQIVSQGAGGPAVSIYLDHAMGEVLHGQGRAIRHFWVDFKTGEVGETEGAPFYSTSYAPKHPNQTGGLWAYMGLTFDQRTIRDEDLYALGGYAGWFQKDDGELLTEHDMPQLQADSHIHEHSTDPGWILYTWPSTPWRDRMAFFEDNQDAQHCCLFTPLAQRARAFPRNEGFKMLLEAYVHVFTRAYPSSPRGTTHANPGGEREQGRVLKEGANVYLALLQDAPKLANLVGFRVAERWLGQVQQFKRLQAATGFGFASFGNAGYYSASEIGIHYWGLEAVRRVLERIGDIAELNFMQREASRWLFESFRFFDIPGDRRWGVPYYERADHTTELAGPASSSHFAWLGATRHEPRNPTEADKMKRILELGDAMDDRFKR